MWEIKFYSKGGQGAVLAAKILVDAAINDRKFGQAIPFYGQERKGAPMYTYVRINQELIDLKSYIYNPNCVVCFDTALTEMGIDILEGVVENTILVVNADTNMYFSERISDTVLVSAERITNITNGYLPTNMVMLGATAKATKCVSIESLEKAIMNRFSGEEGILNAKTCRRAFEEAVFVQ